MTSICTKTNKKSRRVYQNPMGMHNASIQGDSPYRNLHLAHSHSLSHTESSSPAPGFLEGSPSNSELASFSFPDSSSVICVPVLKSAIVTRETALCAAADVRFLS